MSDTLLIWLGETLSAPWAWSVGATETGWATTDADKAALSDMPVNTVTVIVPGQWVRIFDHVLPDMRPAEMRKAAGFSIEDQLGASVADQHIALASKGSGYFAAVTQDKMTAIIAALADAGLSPNALYADFHYLSDTEFPVRVTDRIIIPGDKGYSVDADWANDLLTPAITEAIHSQDVFELLKAGSGRGGVNLLQDSFVPRSTYWPEALPWRRAALVLASLSLSFLLWQGMQARAISQQADILRADMATLYTQATGRAAPANPALDVTRAVKSGGGAKADFLSLSATLFDAVSRVEGVGVEVLQFDYDKAELSLRLIYPNFESAGEVERAVIAAGGRLQSGGVREQGGQFIGDALLSQGSGS